MLLAIDIGNTNITIGVFEDERLRASWHIATGIHRLTDEYAALLLDLLGHEGIAPSQVDKAALCSVVPPLTPVFEELCQRYCGVTPLVVEAGIKTGMRIAVDNPRELGADRVVNAVAAHHLYGGPVIIIDLGTATTFDAVSEKGEYLGGAIAPGIGIASEALFMRTAMLPRVEFVCPKQAIGRNTVAAMQSGIVFGYMGLIESVVSRMRQELGGEVKVIATGGFAHTITREIPIIEEINPDLPLVGLRLIYEMNRS